MELWDAYWDDGRLAGMDLVRGEPIPPGLYHLVSEVLVRHRDGDYLLMQRAFSKPNFGGRFEATAGGSAKKGEDALTCARRELREETGLEADELTPLGQCVSSDTIYRTFLCVTDCAKDAIKLRPEETAACRWVSEAEFIRFVRSGGMIPTQRAYYAGYLKEMGYLGP